MKRALVFAAFLSLVPAVGLAQEEHEGYPVEHEPTTAAEEEHGASEHGAEHGHAEIKWTEFGAMILNFILWAIIIVVLLRKPLTSFLTGRRLEVVEGLEESKRLKEAAEQKYAEYSERLEHLDEELEKLRQEMIQAGESERDRIIAEAESRAARMRRDAQFLIDQQMKQLRVDLTREAIEAAIGAAEKVLTAQTGEQDQQRLADAYLTNLESSLKKDDEVAA